MKINIKKNKIDYLDIRYTIETISLKISLESIFLPLSKMLKPPSAKRNKIILH